MRRALIGVMALITLLLILPYVHSASVTCPSTINVDRNDEITCWVNAKDNVSVRIVEIDGIKNTQGRDVFIRLRR